MGLNARFLLTLLRRWWIPILVVPAICGALALAFGMSRTPMYASTATLLVSVPSSSTLDEYNANLLARDLRETYMALITTDPVLDAVAASVAPRTTAEALRDSITVSESSGALFLVTVIDSDPQRAANLVNALTAELTAFVRFLDAEEGSAGHATLNTLAQGTRPDDPYAPRLPAYLALGIIAGMVVSAVGIALAEHLDTRIRRAADLPSVAGVHPLAVIPRIRRRLTGADTIFLDNRGAESAADSLRSMRNVLLATQGAEKGRSMLVASAGIGDGKSLVAANLAEAIARTGKLVVLVDANFWEPTLHTIYNLDNSEGLGSVLEDPERSWSSVAVRVSENLAVIPAGTVEKQPSDLLMSTRFSQVMGELCAASDMVVLDSPALEEASDAIAAATFVDQVVLVCRLKRTRVEALERARAQFEETGTPVLGAIVNGGAGFNSWPRFRLGALVRRLDWVTTASRSADAEAGVGPAVGHASSTGD